MNKTQKKAIKISILLLGFLTLLILTTQLILTYPGFLLKESFTYKNFEVLSDKAIAPDFYKRLETIGARLRKTGFYNKSEKFNIIICDNEALSTFFNYLSLAPAGVGFHHFSGNIYLFSERIDSFKKENPNVIAEHQKLIEYSYQSFVFEDILMHEMLHKLHSDTLGLWQFKTTMSVSPWKTEGFAEYYTYLAARTEDKSYNFRERVELYLKYRDSLSLFYLRSQLLYEYLTDYEKMSFAEIMEGSVTEEQTFNKLIEWYKKHPNTPNN